MPSRALFLVKADGAPADPPLEGRRIGHYTLGPEIGRGGMSVVYRATRTNRLFRCHRRSPRNLDFENAPQR